MTPNASVYGAPNTWVPVLPSSGRNEDNKNFIPAYYTIGGGINAGKINYSLPLDNSICYAAIAEDSPAAGVYFAAGDDIAHPVENKPFKEDFFISNGDYGSGLFNTIPYYDLTDTFPQKYTYAIGSTPLSNNPNMGIKPLCSVSLKDLVFCVYVVGYNSTYTDYKISTYNGYKQQYSASHPNITRIFAVPYTRGENTNNRTAMSNGEQFNFNGICRMSQYTIPNVSEPQYDYFSPICRDNYTDYQIAIHLWGIPENTGSITFYSSSPSYIYRAIGSGGEFTAANGNLYYSRPWDAAYQQHAGDDWIRRVVASYGVFFVDRTSYAQSAAYASANMMLGTIDADGLCHGDYTTGADNTEQPQYNWESTNDSTYDPDKPIDPNKYVHSTSLPLIPYYSPPNRVYVIDDTTILPQVLSVVSSLDKDDIDMIFYDQEPLECIVGFRRVILPFPTVDPEYGMGATVVLGSFNSEIGNGHVGKLLTEWGRFILNPTPIFERYKNFLDYEPYTTISLYIPFCGSKQLPTNVFMGHTCNITINANARTGDIEAIIYVDNIEYSSMKGNCSIDLAVSGKAMAEYAKAYKELQHQANQVGVQMLSSTLGHAAGATISTAFKNYGGAGLQAGMAGVDIVSAFENAFYIADLQEHLAPNPLEVQKAAETVSVINCLTPFIFIERPVYMESFTDAARTKYAKSTGYACYEIGNLSDFTGFTQAINPVLDGISCTLKERALIEEALREGVILDEPES